jgi:hypothetical protein
MEIIASIRRIQNLGELKGSCIFELKYNVTRETPANINKLPDFAGLCFCFFTNLSYLIAVGLNIISDIKAHWFKSVEEAY